MAVEASAESVSLRYEYENGTASDGTTKYAWKSYSIQNGNATDENIYNAAKAIAGLTSLEIQGYGKTASYRFTVSE